MGWIPWAFDGFGANVTVASAIALANCRFAWYNPSADTPSMVVVIAEAIVESRMSMYSSINRRAPSGITRGETLSGELM